MAKKLNVTNHSDQARNNKIAYEILSKSHPTSKEIFYVFKLHFSKKMAEFAEIVYLHHENGFPIDTQSNKQTLKKFYKQITNPQNMPIELKDKFLKALVGEYARLKYGIDKKVGLKTKIYNSGGQYNLFDLDDSNNTINLINLFIELLSGRKIYYFRAVLKFTDVKERLFI